MQIPGINELILKNIKKDKYQRYLEMMPDFKSEKNEKFIAVVLTLIAIIILGVFAVSPTLSTIVNLQKQLEDAKFLESKLQEKINNLSILDQKYQEIESDLPMVFDALPKTSTTATLEATLQAIMSTSKINSITTLQMSKAEVSKKAMENKKYSSYELHIGASANYSDLILFLDKIVNFQRIITLDNININKPVSSQKTDLEINIKGNAYFKK